MLAAKAVKKSGVPRRIFAVSRYSDHLLPAQLQTHGVETITADLMDEAALAALPNCQNVIYMAGLKFGTTGNEPATWAMNVYLPGRVAARFPDSKIVVFSSGNIYPMMPHSSGGANENTPLIPHGEYAISVLGRERVFDYFSQKNNTPMAFFRLCYAIDMRYGVLRDIAQTVWEGRPVNVSMGAFNCIWQGDANDWALRLLGHCTTPPSAFNITGPERIGIRETALAFGKMLGRDVIFEGTEGTQALINNAAAAHKLFGYPRVTLGQMMEWTAEWVRAGGSSLGKPTHFEATDGKY